MAKCNTFQVTADSLVEHDCVMGDYGRVFTACDVALDYTNGTVLVTWDSGKRATFLFSDYVTLVRA